MSSQGPEEMCEVFLLGQPNTAISWHEDFSRRLRERFEFRKSTLRQMEHRVEAKQERRYIQRQLHSEEHDVVNEQFVVREYMGVHERKL